MVSLLPAISVPRSRTSTESPRPPSPDAGATADASFPARAMLACRWCAFPRERDARLPPMRPSPLARCSLAADASFTARAMLACLKVISAVGGCGTRACALRQSSPFSSRVITFLTALPRRARFAKDASCGTAPRSGSVVIRVRWYFFRSSPNKETLCGVLGLLRVVAVPQEPISGGRETLGPATRLLGQVCVSFFGENQKTREKAMKNFSFIKRGF